MKHLHNYVAVFLFFVGPVMFTGCSRTEGPTAPESKPSDAVKSLFKTSGRPPIEAIAFQDEGTTNINVLSGVSVLDNIWSPGDVVPIGTVGADYYATGTNPAWLDAISFEFDPTGLDLRTLKLRVYLEKGAYYDLFWEHYQVLPGKFNPRNQDGGCDFYPPCWPPDAIHHSLSGNLPANTLVGWVELSFDATSDPQYIQGNGNIGLTLRLWNWRLDAVELVGAVVQVDIDIKPASDPNSINPNSKGVIPVAVLTDQDFDATAVNVSTVSFGPDGAEPVHNGHIEDVDGDGDDDLVLHFKTQHTGIKCGDTEATLTGQTLDGQAIEGSDSIKTVGCK